MKRIAAQNNIEKQDLPDNWEVQEESLNGNGKLRAVYENPETGEKVKVRPYKSYDSLPGFCNCHKVIYYSENGESETVAKGLSQAEYVTEAKNQAFGKINKVAA